MDLAESIVKNEISHKFVLDKLCKGDENHTNKSLCELAVSLIGDRSLAVAGRSQQYSRTKSEKLYYSAILCSYYFSTNSAILCLF